MKFYIVWFYVSPYPEEQYMLVCAKTGTEAVNITINSFKKRGITIRLGGAYLDDGKENSTTWKTKSC